MKSLIAHFMIFMFAYFACSAQGSTKASKGFTLHCKATVTTDSGIQKGYLWQVTDSSLILSSGKKIMGNSDPTQYHPIPDENIIIITVKNKRFPLAEMAGGAILGFVLTAGLWENEDINEDGKLSFWELLFGAIDGTTSQNRVRRRTAIWVGAGGGTMGLLAGAFAKQKLTISFPIDRRRNFLKG